jgi:hypothetical protein
MCAGDIGYQLKPVSGEAVTPDMFQNTQVHSTDYRCKCPKLAHIKSELRRLISEKTPLEVMNQWGRDNIPTLSVEQLRDKYKATDMILAGTNSMGSFYTQLFPDMPKYRVTGTSKQHSNDDIVIGEAPEGVTSEAQHCYTVHSIQGEMAKCNLYIDIKTCFSSGNVVHSGIARAVCVSGVFN